MPDSNVTDYCFDIKLQKILQVLSLCLLSGAGCLSRITVCSKKCQVCYEITRIRLLPSAVVPLHHELQQHTQYFHVPINRSPGG
jgi:hypothetical protein